ncbi:MAG: hypothetical protein M3342_09355 [Bacteroidota bacterium]|nr:hypothetical protein [Flavisolibacter sp.]MBD0300140.1 hypothetical protein [Nitrososphaera sp.]MDQ3844205.1 hypothetical protein [Bacteroidota bacterium]
MTLYDFIELSDNHKAEVVWGGAYIADREDQGHRILLYQVHSFYVEVLYDRTVTNLIETILIEHLKKKQPL